MSLEVLVKNDSIRAPIYREKLWFSRFSWEGPSVVFKGFRKEGEDETISIVLDCKNRPFCQTLPECRSFDIEHIKLDFDIVPITLPNGEEVLGESPKDTQHFKLLCDQCWFSTNGQLEENEPELLLPCRGQRCSSA